MRDSNSSAWIASPAKASDSRPDRSHRRGRGQAKATEETATSPQEPSCNLGDSVGARPRAPKHASQDSCCACSEPGADVPPPFDPNCTDRIEPLKLVSLLVSCFYKSKSCLTWFTKHSLSKPACTLEAVTPSPDLWPIPPPLWSWTACRRSGTRHRVRRLRLRLKAQLLQLVVCALNWECLGHPGRAPANDR